MSESTFIGDPSVMDEISIEDVCDDSQLDRDGEDHEMPTA